MSFVSFPEPTIVQKDAIAQNILPTWIMDVPPLLEWPYLWFQIAGSSPDTSRANYILLKKREDQQEFHRITLTAIGLYDAIVARLRAQVTTGTDLTTTWHHDSWLQMNKKWAKSCRSPYCILTCASRGANGMKFWRISHLDYCDSNITHRAILIVVLHSDHYNIEPVKWLIVRALMRKDDHDIRNIN